MRYRTISLLGLFAIVTIAALVVSHVMTSLKLARVSEELRGLRERLELTPVDEGTNLIAARSLPATDKDVRRWNVRLPKDSEKMLYVNFGEAPISQIRNTTAKTTSKLPLTVDPATHETWIEFKVEPNPNNPEWGSIQIKTTGGGSTIAIDPATTSLLLGKLPGSGRSIGDKTVTRPADAPVTLYAFESDGDPKASFCLWIDAPSSQGDK